MKKKNLLLTFLLAALAFGGVMAQKALPYSYGFENNNLAGEGWTMYNNDGGTGIGTYPYYEGSRSFMFKCGENLSNPQYLITPLLGDSHILKLSFYTRVSSNTSIKYRVGYSTSNTPSITTNFEGWTDPVTLTSSSYSIVELTFEVEGIKYLAIEFDNYNSDATTSHYMSIDNVFLEAISSCSTPSDLTCIHLTTNSATFDWTENGTADTWQVVYSTNPDFVPNSATPITVTTKPYTLRGLTTGTTYYAYVRSYCDADNQSAWSNKCAITPSTNVTLTANDGTKTNSSVPVYYYSIDNASYDFRSQFIIPSSNLNVMKGGKIQKITFYNNNASLDYGDAEFDVYLGEVNYTTIESFCDWSNLTKVYSGGITVNSDKEMELSFSTAYTYQGGNLLIGFYRTKKGTKPTYDSWYGISTNYNSSIYATASSAFEQFIPKTTFTYTPAIKFATAGNWNVTDNWYGNIPSSTDNVLITAAVTIPNGYTATANNITIDGGSLTIEDGGNLICNNNVNATISRTITPFSSANDKGHWYLIASPMTDEYLVSESGLTSTTPSNYDLYIFDQYYEGQEWRNYKGTGEGHFTHIKNKVGYLYASAENTSVSFTGTLNNTDGNINLTKIDGKDLSGMNLIGNPYPCQTGIGKSFYRIVDNDGVSELISYPAGTLINPMEGIVVEAATNGETVAFTKAASGGSKGAISLNLGKNNSTLDRAIVSFDEDGELTKFMLNPDNTKIYIPGEEKDYAVVSANAEGEMPVNFKANADGQYTISVNTEDVEMSYLHLIDNLTGADIDLMDNPSYTFDANASDYASRFRIVFSGNGIEENLNESDNFAFIGSNGQLIVNGTGTIQIIDIMGRVISTRSTEEHINTNNMTAGVYVLQLTTGSETKTQKIIVK